MMRRNLTFFDRCIEQFDQAVRTMFGQPAGSGRTNPAQTATTEELTATDKAESICLMRVNHAGEVCAQALYQGQSLTARDAGNRATLEAAAREEEDHLAWSADRVHELGSRLSLLNPLWYAGSYAIGALAGLAGDRWSLGFVRETENQVETHLQEHIERLPQSDRRSHAILDQMKADEAQHGRMAEDAGGRTLPAPVRRAMTLTAGIMKTLAYRI